MNWTAIGNTALFAILIGLAVAATFTLTGLDRWLDERRMRRDQDRFDVFSEGRWFE